MAKPSKAAIARRLEKKNKRDTVKSNKKGYPGLKKS